MTEKIHTFSLALSMKLINEISKVDRFDASWSQIEKREGQTLKQLKAIATVRSVGASTRIEGSRMTDEEVKLLIDKISISKLEERDQQEVAGYFEALDTITESYKDIEVSEGSIKNLHKILMRFSQKDEWHKGDYKQLSNAVEATHQDGSKQIVFQTTEPGLPTQEAMRQLITWYHADKDTLPVVKVALFVYDFLSIHPFQDGNGRLSRLLGTLLLLRHGYTWIQYVSFEHEIENRKAEYYKVLMQTQQQRPGEQVDEWVFFFLDCLLRIQEQLMNKLESSNTTVLAPRERKILAFIENHPGSKSGEIAVKLDIPLSTVKKILTSMVAHKMILKYGAGAGINYIAPSKSPLKKDLMFTLTDNERTKSFLLDRASSYIEIKKIILTPLFPWSKPDEWASRLVNEGLRFTLSCKSDRGSSFHQLYTLISFNQAHYFQPVFTLHSPIRIPESIIDKTSLLSDYPMTATIELSSTTEKISFEVLFVYDEV